MNCKLRNILKPNSNKHDIFELLPYILLENAKKYRTEGHNIPVSFFSSPDGLAITVTNFGVRPDPAELRHLTERGFRSSHTNGIKGQGLGLYIAKKICDILGITLEFSLGRNIQTIAGKDYSDFNAIITIPNTLITGTRRRY